MNKKLCPLLPVLAMLALSCSPMVTKVAPLDGGVSRPPAEAPLPRRVGRAKAADGTLLYWEAVGSGPAIVFVHGLGGNHAVWFQQVAHFARTHTVLTYSQRGFAPSGGDPTRFEVDRLVRDLQAVMDDAGVGSAVVVGQSMGGWTALGLALQAPKRVDALVLADTFAGIPDPALDEQLARMTQAATQLKAAPLPFAVHPALSAEFSARRPDLAYLYQTLSTFGSPAPGVIAGQLAASRAPAAAVDALRVPTLFVVGSEDRLFPAALIEKAAAHVHGSKVVRIDGAGHSPYFEKPAAWDEAVDAFLAPR